MSCTNNFVLNKGLRNVFDITIKQNGSTLPLEIDAGDTFKVFLFKLSDNTQTATSDDPTITVDSTVDPLNGKLQITFEDTLVSGLVSERGSKVDRYYTLPTYRLVIDCDTLNNGPMVIKIPNVYVE